MNSSLRITISNQSEKRVLQLEKSNVKIGSAPQSDVLFEDTTIAPEHARAWCENGRIWIQDLDSKAGTWLNGALLPPLTPMLVSESDVLRFGKSLATVSMIAVEARGEPTKQPPPEPRSTPAPAHREPKVAPERLEILDQIKKASARKFAEQFDGLWNEIKKIQSERGDLQKSMAQLRSENQDMKKKLTEGKESNVSMRHWTSEKEALQKALDADLAEIRSQMAGFAEKASDPKTAEALHELSQQRDSLRKTLQAEMNDFQAKFSTELNKVHSKFNELPKPPAGPSTDVARQLALEKDSLQKALKAEVGELQSKFDAEFSQFKKDQGSALQRLAKDNESLQKSFEVELHKVRTKLSENTKPQPDASIDHFAAELTQFKKDQDSSLQQLLKDHETLRKSFETELHKVQAKLDEAPKPAPDKTSEILRQLGQEKDFLRKMFETGIGKLEKSIETELEEIRTKLASAKSSPTAQGTPDPQAGEALRQLLKEKENLKKSFETELSTVKSNFEAELLQLKKAHGTATDAGLTEAKSKFAGALDRFEKQGATNAREFADEKEARQKTFESDLNQFKSKFERASEAAEKQTSEALRQLAKDQTAALKQLATEKEALQKMFEKELAETHSKLVKDANQASEAQTTDVMRQLTKERDALQKAFEADLAESKSKLLAEMDKLQKQQATDARQLTADKEALKKSFENEIAQLQSHLTSNVIQVAESHNAETMHQLAKEKELARKALESERVALRKTLDAELDTLKTSAEAILDKTIGEWKKDANREAAQQLKVLREEFKKLNKAPIDVRLPSVGPQARWGIIVALAAVIGLAGGIWRTVSHSKSEGRRTPASSTTVIASTNGSKKSSRTAERTPQSQPQPEPLPTQAPAHAADYLATYTDNILYLKNFSRLEQNEAFRKKWMAVLAKKGHDLKIDSFSVPPLVFEEKRLIDDLVKIAKADPSHSPSNVAKMREREKEFQKYLNGVFKDPSELDRFWELKRNFFQHHKSVSA